MFAGQARPVSYEETLEIMTLMQAADLSKQRGGLSVQMQEVWQHHHNEAQQIVAEILKK